MKISRDRSKILAQWREYGPRSSCTSGVSSESVFILYGKLSRSTISFPRVLTANLSARHLINPHYKGMRLPVFIHNTSSWLYISVFIRWPGTGCFYVSTHRTLLVIAAQWRFSISTLELQIGRAPIHVFCKVAWDTSQFQAALRYLEIRNWDIWPSPGYALSWGIVRLTRAVKHRHLVLISFTICTMMKAVQASIHNSIYREPDCLPIAGFVSKHIDSSHFGTGVSYCSSNRGKQTWHLFSSYIGNLKLFINPLNGS